jgi:hypothetical protein
VEKLETPVPEILNTQEPDTCCSKPWSKAARAGGLDKVELWTCPKCGCQWRARLIDGLIRHWTPEVVIQVW